jgi:CRISPR/Cas system-associated exonuclease Cas4 (RecB family)
MPRAELRCELSWSVSREREFRRCPREAWYARYGTWGWWQERPRGERWGLMVLKNLTTLPAFSGDCLHRAIADWLGERRAERAAPDATWLFERAREHFRAGWRESSQGGWSVKPNQRVHLAEHHYGPTPERERTDAARDLLERGARFFVGDCALAEAREAPPEEWLALEELDRFELESTPVYAVPDFAYRADGRVHIWDWKSGRPRDEDLFQLHTYALFARERWGADPASTVLHLAYLGSNQVRTLPADPARIARVERQIASSICELRAVHYDPDREPARMESWPADPSPSKCGDCRFRGVCADKAV